MDKAAIGIWGAVPITLLQDKEARKYVYTYAAIASFQGGNDACFPSFSAIGKRAGCSKSTVIRSIERLVELGWLAKTKRGECKSNSYCVLFPITKTGNINETSSIDDTSSSSTGDTPLVAPVTPIKEQLKEKVKEHNMSPSTDSLFNKIWDSFLKVNKNYPDYATAKRATKKVCAMIRNVDKSTPEETGLIILRTFYKMTKGKSFISGLAFSPIKLQSAALFETVLAESKRDIDHQKELDDIGKKIYARQERLKKLGLS